jgi:hypothetical protein
MSKYGDYLKSMGASEEEIKILDTPTAARAYDKLQAEAATAAAEAARIKAEQETYVERVDAWYQENDKKLKDSQAKQVAVESEAARYRAALVSAQRQGLIDVAKDLGFNPEELEGVTPPARKEPAVPDGFDPSKFVDRDTFIQGVDRMADSLAALEDMVIEHKLLFPDKPLRVSELRREAIAAKKTVNQLWEEKYKVPEARTAAAEAQRKAEEDRIRKDERDKAAAEFANKYGNPDTRIPMPSTSPFTKRANDPVRAKQPWEAGGDSTLSNDRVARATKKFMEREVTH